MTGLFRKKPVQVEAIQFTGHNDLEIWKFVKDCGYDPDDNRPTWVIRTLHGLVTAEVGDWIIRGPQGDFWPCKPDIFEDSYEQCGEIVEPINPELEGCGA